MPRGSRFRAGVAEGLDSALTARMGSGARILRGRETASGRTGLREAAKSAGAKAEQQAEDMEAAIGAERTRVLDWVWGFEGWRSARLQTISRENEERFGSSGPLIRPKLFYYSSPLL